MSVHYDPDLFGEFCDMFELDDQKWKIYFVMNHYEVEKNGLKNIVFKDKLNKFECLICKQQIKQKKNAINHVSKHYGVWNYHCTQCGGAYSTEKGARKHYELCGTYNPTNMYNKKN